MPLSISPCISWWEKVIEQTKYKIIHFKSCNKRADQEVRFVLEAEQCTTCSNYLFNDSLLHLFPQVLWKGSAQFDSFLKLNLWKKCTESLLLLWLSPYFFPRQLMIYSYNVKKILFHCFNELYLRLSLWLSVWEIFSMYYWEDPWSF